MFRHLTAAILLFAAAPALAQSDATVLDRIPMVISGVTDAAPGYLGPMEAVPVTRTAPGAFTISDGKHEGMLATTEIAPCVFEMGLTLDGKVLGALRVDAGAVTEFVYSEQPPMGARTRFDVEFKGAPDAMLMVAPTGETRAMPVLSGAKTGATLDDVRAAAAALKQACP